MIFDYYKILGVVDTATDREIKTAFRNKMKEYHPDKLKNKNETDMELDKTKFYLIKEAGETLTNPTSKSTYDFNRKTNKNNNYKLEFEEYIKNMPKYDTSDDEIVPVPEKIPKETLEGASRKYEDIVIQREQGDIENTHKNIFKEKNFDEKIFNNIFEKLKKKSQDPSKSIVKFENIAGTEGLCEGNFADIQECENFDNTEQCSLSDYSSVSPASPVKPIEVVYDKYIQERENEDVILKNIEFKKTQQELPQMSKDFGHMLGNQMGGTERENTAVQQIIMDAYSAITGTFAALL
jgi:curved DNA-binding protein CbpA